jgi:putative DNA primase/helicase
MATRKFEKCRLTGGARALAGISLRPKPPSDSYRGGYPYRDD